MTSHRQLSLDFEPGLTAKHRSLEDMVAHVVHTSRSGVDGVASKLDMGSSELCRRLNAHLDAKAGDISNRPLRLHDFVQIMEAEQDFRPIYWLIEKYLQDPGAKRDAAIATLAQLVPLITNLAAEAGIAISTPQPNRKR